MLMMTSYATRTAQLKGRMIGTTARKMIGLLVTIIHLYLTGVVGVPSVPRSPAECTPSWTVFDGCNWCTCAIDGATEVCTLQFCDQVDPMACTPGKTRYDGCTWCVCASSGRREYCHDRFCSRPLKRRRSPSSMPMSHEHPSCKPSKHWYDGCNWCSSCNDDKAAVTCSTRVCSRRRTRSASKRHNEVGCGGWTQGDIWFNGCSWCRCDNNAVHCRPPPDVCTQTSRCGQHDAGSVWQDGCSLCMCLPEGGSLCTKDLCGVS